MQTHWKFRATLETCARTRVDAERLACYDQIVAPQVRGAAEASGAASSAPAIAALANADRPKPIARDDGSYLGEFLGAHAMTQARHLQLHRLPAQLVFPRAHDKWSEPRAEHACGRARRHAARLPQPRGEAADLGPHQARRGPAAAGRRPLVRLHAAVALADLQRRISRPFRATDHEPDPIYIVPTPLDVPFGFKRKMVGLELAHQSNGQAPPFSRRWNRLYGLAGLENGDVALTARYNWRIHESDGQDDNPDFTKYRGRTELLAI